MKEEKHVNNIDDPDFLMGLGCVMIILSMIGLVAIIVSIV